MASKKSEATNGESSASGGDIAVTPGEVKLMMSVMRNSTRNGKPWIGGTVHWDNVSEEMSLKSGKTARDRMSQKFGLFEAEAPAAANDVAAPAPAQGSNGAATNDKALKSKKAAAAPMAKGKGKRPANDADVDTSGNDDQSSEDHSDSNDGSKKVVKKVHAKKHKFVPSEYR